MCECGHLMSFVVGLGLTMFSKSTCLSCSCITKEACPRSFELCVSTLTSPNSSLVLFAEEVVMHRTKCVVLVK